MLCKIRELQSTQVKSITLKKKNNIIHFSIHEKSKNDADFSSLEKRPAATAKSLQSCPTLCDPRDGSPPGSPIPGILQARTLKWVVISFSDA